VKTQAQYPVKVQAIRSKGQKARPYVFIPISLAVAIGMEAGEEVEWELLSRDELCLVRRAAPKPRAGRHATSS
jgi:hypothetical protein